MNGRSGFTWYSPRVISQSTKPAPAAWTSIRARPSPAIGLRDVLEPQGLRAAGVVQDERSHGGATYPSPSALSTRSTSASSL